MLRITVDVNGRKIRQIAMVNITGNKRGMNTYHIYDVSDVPSHSSVTEYGEKLGEVEHRYEDGDLTLIRKSVAEIEHLSDTP